MVDRKRKVDAKEVIQRNPITKNRAMVPMSGTQQSAKVEEIIVVEPGGIWNPLIASRELLTIEPYREKARLLDVITNGFKSGLP